MSTEIKIQEELISFETAVLAKEKGFNIETWDYFSSHDDKGEQNIIPSCNSNRFNYNNYEAAYLRNPCETLHSRPSQSLLQRWLREVYKIDIVVHGFKKQPVGEEIWDEVYQVFVLDFAYHPYFKTYEEALEKGLKQALRKIEY